MGDWPSRCLGFPAALGGGCAKLTQAFLFTPEWLFLLRISLFFLSQKTM